jgi:hypothetical protein
LVSVNSDRSSLESGVMLKRFMVITTFTLLLGCSNNSPFEYIAVQGQLTYEDGSTIPAKGIRLQFITIDVKPHKGAHPRPATTQLNSQGHFDSVTSYKYGDGLVPGRHKVAIFYATDKNGKLLVPKAYTHAATTPLIVDTADTPLKIKVPKP